MRNRKIVLILLVIIVVIVIAIFMKSKNKPGENVVEQDVSEEREYVYDGSIINISEKSLKEAVERTEDGIIISDVRINSVENNVIDMALTVTNEMDKERKLSLAVLYLDEDEQVVGKNEFDIDTLEANERVELQSICNIERPAIESIKLELIPEPLDMDIEHEEE